MSPRRVVVGVSVQRLSKEAQDTVALGVKSLGSQSCLILCVDAPVYEAGRPKGKQVENSLKKAVSTTGCVVTCQAPDAKDLRARALELIHERGKNADREVIELLAAKSISASSASGGDLNTLTSEIDKLVTYVGQNENITIRDAESLIAIAPEENIFKLLDAVTARDLKSAVRNTEILLDSGEKPDGIVARTLVMLQRQFRILSLAKALGQRPGGVKSAVTDEFKALLSGELIGLMSSQGYRLNGYAQTASRFTWSQISEAMENILLCDMVLKGIDPGTSQKRNTLFKSGDPSENLKMLVLELCKS
jgi:DNA polymerase III delta subunit